MGTYNNLYTLTGREILKGLLQRDIIEPVLPLMYKNIKGNTVLITGAGGTIGSEVCKQLLACQPRIIIAIDNSEFNLYKLQQDIENINSNIIVKTFLLSLDNKKDILNIFNTWKPDVVIHTAAYKHVNLVECNIIQGIKNNVFNTAMLVNISILTNVKYFIFISTDKAVKPTNVMGMTKRVAEMILHKFNKRNKTIFNIVRFGNVLDSSGSVIPKFKQQILHDKCVTITHPDVARYFITVEEAAQLIIQVCGMTCDNTRGYTFTLDMGVPISIISLANYMVKFAGFTIQTASNSNVNTIEIKFTGLCKGEKVIEDLYFYKNIEKTEHSKIFKVFEGDLNFSTLSKLLNNLKKDVYLNNEDLALQVLTKIINL